MASHQQTRGEIRRGAIEGLPVVRGNVAGVDLGSERHWVCGPAVDGNGREVADFGATTPELIRMAEWLKEGGWRRWRWRARGSTGSLRSRFWKGAGWRCCWWIRGNWRACRGGTRKRTRPTVSGFNGCTVVDCCEF